jgi:PD-(D/E)XK nuclease superfamily
VSTDPTGLEPRTPLRIADTSATERAVFRSCRRRWLLSTAHRLGRVEGHSAFLFGTAVHAGLARFYAALHDEPGAYGAALGPALQGFDDSWGASMEALEDDLGFLWPEYREAYAEDGRLGHQMLEGYAEREERSPIRGTPVSIEQRFAVPILSPSGHPVGELSVQLDLVMERPDGRIAVVDHKTAAGKPNSGQLDLDDQLTAYCWAYLRHTGEMPREEVYNVLLKKAAHEPAVLKARPTKADPDPAPKLSRDRAALTTAALYRSAIDRLGLDPNDYAEHLLWLAEGGPEFYYRESVFRTRGQMASFERNLYHEFQDMRRVAARPELAYPNPSRHECPSCPVRDVCQSMMEGGDAAGLIRSEYVVLPPRR